MDSMTGASHIGRSKIKRWQTPFSFMLSHPRKVKGTLCDICLVKNTVIQHFNCPNDYARETIYGVKYFEIADAFSGVTNDKETSFV